VALGVTSSASNVSKLVLSQSIKPCITLRLNKDNGERGTREGLTPTQLGTLHTSAILAAN